MNLQGSWEAGSPNDDIRLGNGLQWCIKKAMSCLSLKKVDRFRSGFVLVFVYLHGNREDLRAFIGHDVRITHYVHQVFEIPLCNV
jgi:hypothetical protein